jgi:WD repeat-containing protein 70
MLEFYGINGTGSHVIKDWLLKLKEHSALWHRITWCVLGGTGQVWDLRKFKEPCQVHTDLPTLHAETSVIFSPDETLMVTGVAAGRDGSGGALVFFDRVRGELVSRLAMPSSVVSVLWHSRLNQIFVGLGVASLHVCWSFPSLSPSGLRCVLSRALQEGVI